MLQKIKLSVLSHPLVPPVINDPTMPEDQLDVVPASNVSFSVVVSGNNLMYLWMKDGTTVIDGSKYNGATTSTLTVIAVEQDDDGIYSCVVSNTGGFVIPRGAQLVSICKLQYYKSQYI